MGIALYIVPAGANGLKKTGGSKKTGTVATVHKSSKPSGGKGRSASKTAGTPSSSGTSLNLYTSGKGLKAGPNLAPGSNPQVLPTDVLIADRTNSRLLIVNPAGKIVWQFPRPGDLSKGQSFLLPDDAFFTPNGKYIVATEEDDQVISLISIAQHKIIWRYGTPGVPGSGPNHVSNPDDAMMLSNGDIITADIKNCSILILRPPLHVPIERIGENNPYCYHQPPLRFGSPNGAFPLTDGNYLITEINGDWADEMTLGGKILWSANPPGVAYPSDTNEIAPNKYLTVDYSIPGQIVEFNSSGNLLWRYKPLSGPGALNEPSLCRPIETNGDILCNDDGDDRVIVVDPKTNKIVWQYGHDHVPGTAAGYLHRPDGVDLAPPYSLTMIHASTMGLPNGKCSPTAPQGTCIFYTASGAPSSTPTSVTRLGLGPQQSPYADPNAAFGNNNVGTAKTHTRKPHLTAVMQEHKKRTLKAKKKSGERLRSTGGKAGKSISSLPAAKLFASWHMSIPLSRGVVLPLGGGNVLVAGGMEANGNTTPAVYLANTVSHSSRQVGTLTDATHDASGAVLNGNAYIFGGGDINSISTVQEITSASGNLVKALHFTKGSRKAKPTTVVTRAVGNLSVPRSDSTSVVTGSGGYIVGGYSGTGPDANVLFTNNGKKIISIGHLAVPVRYPAVAVSGHFIYVFGGEEVSGPQAGQPTSVVQSVNVNNGSSSVIARLPEPLAGAQAADISGHIVVCGGDRSVNSSGVGSETDSSIAVFNQANDKFTTIGKLPTPVSHAGVVVSGSTMWLFGGESDGAVESIVQSFNF